MFPTLLTVGPFSLPTYGLLAALGVALGTVWTLREAKRSGVETEKILDLAFLLILGGIIGARVFHIIISWNYYRQDILSVLKFWTGGLVFYGGLFIAVLVFIVYIRVKELPFWKTADLFAPGLALGQGIGRLGCLAAGCCYGRPVELPWSIIFTHPQSLAYPLGEPLHPTQLYASFLLFGLFGFLVLFRKQKAFDGQIFLTYATLHALIRMVLEYFRADFRGSGPFGFLTLTQTISLSMIILCPLVMFYLYKKHGQQREAIT
ncbi:MAG: prolipoprotein diacylglyceryl transferase [Deltaproteobacteria bacterium]|nr:prolipoprotein diacylglyceryl transferase [Deltaproteobacteria bacterium]